jgi:hypothetical protein
VIYLYHYGELRNDKIREADKALKLLSSRKICKKFEGKIIRIDGNYGYKVYMSKKTAGLTSFSHSKKHSQGTFIIQGNII